MKKHDIKHCANVSMVEDPQGFWIGSDELLEWLEALAIEIKNTAGYDSPPYRMCSDLITELEN